MVGRIYGYDRCQKQRHLLVDTNERVTIAIFCNVQGREPTGVMQTLGCRRFVGQPCTPCAYCPVPLFLDAPSFALCLVGEPCKKVSQLLSIIILSTTIFGTFNLNMHTTPAACCRWSRTTPPNLSIVSHAARTLPHPPSHRNPLLRRSCDVISVEAAGEEVVVQWRLSGRINLPFKPPIKPYVVTTTFERDSGAVGGVRNSAVRALYVRRSDVLLCCCSKFGLIAWKTA